MNEVDEKQMSEYIYQKIYFQETFIQYPTVNYNNYNQILLSLVEKYNVKKVVYNHQNFSVLKNDLNKKNFSNISIEEKLDNIKLLGKKLMNCKLEYIDKNNKDIEKKFRIYGTNKSMKLLRDKEISQYFTDCTYKCLPSELLNKSSLLVL